MSFQMIGLAIAAILLVWFIVEKLRRKTHPMSGGIHNDINLPHTQELELYSNSFSHCSRKARLVMAELGINYKHHHVDLIETGWYQTISSAYLKVNPAGLVPVFLHNGHPIYESDDILKYAQEVAGPDAPDLVPDDKELETKMHEWLSYLSISSDDPLAQMGEKAGACIPGLTVPLFVTTIQYIPLRKILVGFLFHSDKKRPAFFSASKLLGHKKILSIPFVKNMTQISQREMKRHLTDINGSLKDLSGPWVLGDHFSLADISLGCLILRMDETGWLEKFHSETDLSEVLNYYKRLQTRPSWQDAVTNHAHPIVEKATQDLKQIRAAEKW